MKLYDFDAKFYDYVRVQMALQPAIKEDEIEEKYNQMMESWLNAPAQWLDGVKPIDYFKRYEDPKDLLKLLEEYMKRDMGLPEPLYSRIVEVGKPCEAGLARIVGDPHRKESLRATAIALLRDMESQAALDHYIDLICNSEDEEDELAELACDALNDMELDLTDRLMERYDDAAIEAKRMILELCVNGGGGQRVYDLLLDGLRRDHDYRGLYAMLLADVGDERAIEPLRDALQLSDLEYLDYISIREAIEALGGDPGELRDFNGDPDFEALRNL